MVLLLEGKENSTVYCTVCIYVCMCVYMYVVCLCMCVCICVVFLSHHAGSRLNLLLRTILIKITCTSVILLIVSGVCRIKQAPLNKCP